MDQQRALSWLEEGTLYGADGITAQCLTFFGTKCAIRLWKKILEILTLSIWLLSVVTLEQADLGNHYSIKYSSHFARERCEFYSDEDEEL